MRLLSTAVYSILTMMPVSALNASFPSENVEVVVNPSSDGVHIDIHIELAVSKGNFNSTGSVIEDMSSTTSPTNSTALSTAATHVTCSSNGHAMTQGSPIASSAVTTQGFFLNSTGSPAATGRFQSPSLIDLAAFSGGGSTKGQPAFSSVLLVAAVAMSLV